MVKICLLTILAANKEVHKILYALIYNYDKYIAIFRHFIIAIFLMDE